MHVATRDAAPGAQRAQLKREFAHLYPGIIAGSRYVVCPEAATNTLPWILRIWCGAKRVQVVEAHFEVVAPPSADASPERINGAVDRHLVPPAVRGAPMPGDDTVPSSDIGLVPE
jgi:hypothetical protein